MTTEELIEAIDNLESVATHVRLRILFSRLPQYQKRNLEEIFQLHRELAMAIINQLKEQKT